jgi:hypothetical protein
VVVAEGRYAHAGVLLPEDVRAALVGVGPALRLVRVRAANEVTIRIIL